MKAHRAWPAAAAAIALLAAACGGSYSGSASKHSAPAASKGFTYDT